MRSQAMQYWIRAAQLAVVASALTASVAYAEEDQTRFSIGPLIGYRGGGSFTESDTGTKLKLDAAQTYGLVADFRVTRETDVELLWSRQLSSLSADAPVHVPLFDVHVDYYHIGGTYRFSTEGLQPFFVATIGATRFAPQNSAFTNETKFSFGVGGGVLFPIGKHFGLRAEARAYGTVLDNDSAIMCNGATCLVHVDGTLMWQYEASAGVYLSF